MDHYEKDACVWEGVETGIMDSDVSCWELPEDLETMKVKFDGNREAEEIDLGALYF